MQDLVESRLGGPPDPGIGCGHVEDLFDHVQVDGTHVYYTEIECAVVHGVKLVPIVGLPQPLDQAGQPEHGPTIQLGPLGDRDRVASGLKIEKVP